MPSPEEFTPEVQVSSYADWDAFTTWWWNLIKDQYDVSDAMRAKLEEILEGKTTDEEKLRAIYDFVVTDVRYVAWEFGVHGYKPYRASAIFDRRFGDCKDKALLINALLSEIGLKGYPVLIRA
jgi:cellulose synthase operon protein C